MTHLQVMLNGCWLLFSWPCTCLFPALGSVFLASGIFLKVEPLRHQVILGRTNAFVF